MKSMKMLAAAAIAVRLLSAQKDWPVYGHDPGAQRFSPLTQINTRNVARLQKAWTFHTGKPGSEGIPIVVNGVMYLTGANGIFAIEPETGKKIWHYEATRVALRGLAYWPGDKRTHPRVFAGVSGGMIAIDAVTGKPAPGFANEGLLDLKQGVADGLPNARISLQSPPTVYRNIVITGSANGEGAPTAGAYGDIRGWDAYTGKLVWTFHTVPRPGEPGIETWPADGWKNRSGTNAWGFLTVDMKRGIVYVPLGSPTSDFYGADRHGDGLYGNCLVALDAATGKLKWYQQLVRHDLWDFDPAAPPILFDARRDGRIVPAVAQITKMGILFAFDRVTGKPLYGMEDRPVPQSINSRREDRRNTALSTEAPSSFTSRVHERGNLQFDSGARGFLPRSLRAQSDADRQPLYTAWARRQCTDVPEHAGRRRVGWSVGAILRSATYSRT